MKFGGYFGKSIWFYAWKAYNRGYPLSHKIDGTLLGKEKRSSLGIH